MFVDIDECATSNGGCDGNAVCVNTIASYYCYCVAGYAGNGHQCDGTVQLPHWCSRHLKSSIVTSISLKHTNWHCPQYAAQRLCKGAVSVRLSQLLRVCCGRPREQQISIACCTPALSSTGARRANADSATLSAYVESWTPTCCLLTAINCHWVCCILKLLMYFDFDFLRNSVSISLYIVIILQLISRSVTKH